MSMSVVAAESLAHLWVGAGPCPIEQWIVCILAGSWQGTVYSFCSTSGVADRAV